eukprot:1045105-Rhodomonas_salina.2
MMQEFWESSIPSMIVGTHASLTPSGGTLALFLLVVCLQALPVGSLKVRNWMGPNQVVRGLPQHRWKMSMHALEQKIYMFGGEGSDDPSDVFSKGTLLQKIFFDVYYKWAEHKEKGREQRGSRIIVIDALLASAALS